MANAQSVTTSEDTDKAIVLAGSDVDGDTLTFAVATQPTKGRLLGTVPNLTYTPTANSNGPDSFTFTASDGTLTSAPATVTITVTAVNDAPAADTKSVGTPEDTAVPITLTGTDVDRDALTYEVASQPTKGTLSGTVPNLTYTPNANSNGTDTFTYKANDGVTDSVAATVTITVQAVNDAPVANAQSVTTSEDTDKAIVLAGSDVDGDTLTFAVATQPTKGRLLGTVPNLTYTPTANSNGPDSFTFTASDGTLTSAPATVTITVTAVNDAPGFTKGANQSVQQNAGPQTVPGWAKSISPGPSDESTQTVSFIVNNDNNALFSAQPAIAGDGTLTYTPAANANGLATITVQVRDSGGTANGGVDTSAAQTFTINLAPLAPANLLATITPTSAGGTTANIAAATDGNPNTNATLTHDSGTGINGLVWDLGGRLTLSRIAAKYTAGNVEIVNQIDVSLDGTTWTTLWTDQGESVLFSRVDNAPRTVRYIRWAVTQTSAGTTRSSSLHEIEAVAGNLLAGLTPVVIGGSVASTAAATDGNPNTNATLTHDSGTGINGLVWDIGGQVTLSRIAAKYTAGNVEIVNQIDVSFDGTTWTTLWRDQGESVLFSRVDNAPRSVRYIRWAVTQTSAGTTRSSSLHEIEAVAGNLLAGLTPVLIGGSLANTAAATDSDPNTLATLTHDGGTGTNGLMWDLGASLSVSRIAVKYQAGNREIVNAIDVSLDGANWTTVFTHSGESVIHTPVDTVPRTFRYIRWNVTQTSAGASRVSFLYAIEVA